MNLDQLNMVPAHATLRTAYAGLDGLQGQPSAQQVMAMAVLVRETCQALGLDLSEVIDKARRCARHAEDHYSHELHALRAYIRGELK